jgi:quercetin dioxygenase-like cupin family protein
MWTRKLHAASLAAVIVVAYGPGSALAGQHEGAAKTGAGSEKQAILKTGDSLQWSAGPAALPPGAQAAVLEGDPSKDGMFTMRLKVPAGYKIAPHTHPKVERVTVMSGEFALGMGADFDESKLEKLPEGSFFVLEPGMQHFAKASKDTVLQLNAMGPWAIKYVRASDDPRNAPQARKGPQGEAGARGKK